MAHRIEIYTRLQDLNPLRPQWLDLVAECSSSSIFSTYEWLAPWSNAYIGPDSLVVLAAFDASNRLLGLAPLLRARLGAGLRRLRLLGDGSKDSDHLDIPVRPGSEAEFAAILFQFFKDGHYDVCELNCMPPDSNLGQHLVEGVAQRGWRLHTYAHPCTRISLPDSFQLYLDGLDGAERSRIRRRIHDVESRYDVRFCKVSCESGIQQSLQHLFSLHQKRHAAAGARGAFASAQRRKFYEELTTALLYQNCLHFWLLSLDGRVVATIYGFQHGATVYELQAGFDSDFSADHVGRVARCYLLRELINTGVREYDFLGGRERHKIQLGGRPSSYRDIHFAVGSIRGRIYVDYVHVLRVIRAGLHNQLPEPTFELLKSATRWMNRESWQHDRASL